MLNNQTIKSHFDEKMNGFSYVAPDSPVGEETMTEIANIGGNWISIIPYAMCKSDKANLVFNAHGQYWGECDSGVFTCIQMAHNNGLKVMLKPHVWVDHGAFTGTLDFALETQWQNFEADYSKYIMHYARLADSAGADMMCIGTEFATFAQKRSEFWKKLIQQVRSVYHKPITYAENWDQVQHFPHWNSLDYIGVDAYFPLTSERTPTMKQIDEAWKKPMQLLENIAATHDKKIIFTEYGYRSCEYNCHEPWSSSEELKTNEDNQVLAYKCLYKNIWNQQWFAGGFIWKWFPFDLSHHRDFSDFTPQRKAVLKTIEAQYKAQIK